MSVHKLTWLDGQEIPLAPGKVVCIGRNYVEHVHELNNAMPEAPLLFIKPNSALCDANKVVTLNPELGDHHFESELAILIGKPLNRNNIDCYQEAILGLGVAFDLTLRDLQSALKSKGLPWEKAKAYDNSCPLSSFIAYQGQALDDLEYELRLNNELRQYGHSQNMIFPIESLLKEIVTYFSLMPGDIVLTGTPKGVGKLKDGDRYTLLLGDKLLAEGMFSIE